MNKRNKHNLLSLSEQEQKEIFEQAAREANEEQRELEKRYEEKFGKARQSRAVRNSSSENKALE